jgi:hypothetical protein
MAPEDDLDDLGSAWGFCPQSVKEDQGVKASKNLHLAISACGDFSIPTQKRVALANVRAFYLCIVPKNKQTNNNTTQHTNNLKYVGKVSTALVLHGGQYSENEPTHRIAT